MWVEMVYYCLVASLPRFFCAKFDKMPIKLFCSVTRGFGEKCILFCFNLGKKSKSDRLIYLKNKRKRVYWYQLWPDITNSLFLVYVIEELYSHLSIPLLNETKIWNHIIVTKLPFILSYLRQKTAVIVVAGGLIM